MNKSRLEKVKKNISMNMANFPLTISTGIFEFDLTDFDVFDTISIKELKLIMTSNSINGSLANGEIIIKLDDITGGPNIKTLNYTSTDGSVIGTFDLIVKYIPATKLSLEITKLTTSARAEQDISIEIANVMMRRKLSDQLGSLAQEISLISTLINNINKREILYTAPPVPSDILSNPNQAYFMTMLNNDTSWSKTIPNVDFTQYKEIELKITEWSMTNTWLASSSFISNSSIFRIRKEQINTGDFVGLVSEDDLKWPTRRNSGSSTFDIKTNLNFVATKFKITTNSITLKPDDYYRYRSNFTNYPFVWITTNDIRPSSIDIGFTAEPLYAYHLSSSGTITGRLAIQLDYIWGWK